MAGISKLHTLAAIITPAAKPKKAFCTFSLCPSFLMKKTTAAPNVVIENVKPVPAAAQSRPFILLCFLSDSIMSDTMTYLSL
jgi:hypothetical protein